MQLKNLRGVSDHNVQEVALFAFSSTCFVLLSCISPSTKLAFEVVQADSYSAI
jgi:hypothetical protein